jgi:hypothetical protein
LRNGVKVRVKAALVLAAKEKLMIDLPKSNLLQKARKRTDQAQRVIQKVKVGVVKACAADPLADSDFGRIGSYINDRARN